MSHRSPNDADWDNRIRIVCFFVCAIAGLGLIWLSAALIAHGRRDPTISGIERLTYAFSGAMLALFTMVMGTILLWLIRDELSSRTHERKAREDEARQVKPTNEGGNRDESHPDPPAV